MHQNDPCQAQCVTQVLSLQADLAGKDFTAEKQQVIVISTGNNKAMTAKDQERNALERRAAERRHQHRCATRLSTICFLVSIYSMTQTPQMVC